MWSAMNMNLLNNFFIPSISSYKVIAIEWIHSNPTFSKNRGCTAQTGQTSTMSRSWNRKKKKIVLKICSENFYYPDWIWCQIGAVFAAYTIFRLVRVVKKSISVQKITFTKFISIFIHLCWIHIFFGKSYFY